MVRFLHLFFSVTLLVMGCDRFTPPPRPTIDQIPIEDTGGLGASGLALVTHPRFGGVTDVIGGDGWIQVSWDAATDDLTEQSEIEYLVFVTPFGTAHDLAEPTAILVGETRIRVEDMQNGETVDVMVLARDSDLEVSPELAVWPVTPNPIRYVRSGASQAGADGLTPQTAYPTMGQAIAESIPLGGINFHVAEGLYPENLFLLPGMMVFGGFEISFNPELRDPLQQASQFGILFPTDIVNIRPGDLLSGIDGLILAGNNIAESCVYAEDCICRITRCQLSGSITQGIDLRSDFLEGNVIEAFIGDCLISDCNGEGLRIVGIPQIHIDNSEIRNNLNEGIESQWIHSGFGKEAKVEISRCRVHQNGDEGIDLDLAAIESDLWDANIPSSTRVKIRNCEISENFLEGIVIDIDSSPLDAIDIRVRIDDSQIRDNGLAGVFLDGDAPAGFRISRCQISANGTDGISVSAIPNGSEALVRNCNILGNRRMGVSLLDLCSIFVTRCWITGNGVGPVDAPRGMIQLQDSIASGFDADDDLSSTRYCLISGSNLPFQLPNSSLLGDEEVISSPVEFLWGQWLADGTLHTPIQLPPFQSHRVEVGDDGVLRTYTPLEGGGYLLDPAPVRSRGEVAVFVWEDETGPHEDSTPLPHSLALNNGNPYVLGDGNLPENIGPSGNNALSFVGADPALPDPPGQAQLLSVDPSPSTPQSTARWTLLFSRPPSNQLLDAVHISVNGLDQTQNATKSIHNESLNLVLPGLIPGDFATIEILPHPGLGNGSDLYRVLPYRIGSTIAEDIALEEANDDPFTTPMFPVRSLHLSGELESPQDEDWYLFRVSPTTPLQVEVIARRQASQMIPILEQYNPADLTLIQSASALPPFFFDPFLTGVSSDPSGLLLLKVSGANSAPAEDLSYELIVQP